MGTSELIEKRAQGLKGHVLFCSFANLSRLPMNRVSHISKDA